MRKKKKGESLLRNAVLGMVLTVIALAILLNSPIVRSLLGFFSTEEEQATVNNFNELAAILSSDVKTEGQFSRLHQFYISHDFILVGFNNDDKGSQDECDPEFVPRPSSSECKGNACICLYKENEGTLGLGSDDDFGNNAPFMCRKINADVILTLDYYDENREDEIMYTQDNKIYKNMLGPKFQANSDMYKEEYARFFIYGQCEDWLATDVDFGVQQLYVEKAHDEKEKKTFVFIADSAANDRYAARLKKQEEKQEPPIPES